MEKYLRHLIFVFGTLILMAGVLMLAGAGSWGSAFGLAASFFVLHKLAMAQEAVIAKWEIEDMMKEEAGNKDGSHKKNQK